MCGITGIILKNSDLDPVAAVLSMNDAIQHRGPDGEGYVVSDLQQSSARFRDVDPGFQRRDLPFIPKRALQPTESAKLVFGHRRLAIIDLSETGHQPMCNAKGDTWIVYNGELYNYLELRNELRALGRTFVTQSDTEVILQAYDQWGSECVQRFNGMWAFCIYDQPRRRCFASRDRLGVKPFYYINSTTCFAFASEQKAFVKAGLATSGVRHEALYDYLINGILENTHQNFFEDVQELWPGDHLIYHVDSGELQTSAYYRIRPSLQNDRLGETELIQLVKQHVERSVELRLRSDVEVGTCLSGGIDSSVLAVCIAEQTKKPFHCFTSVFKGLSINEEPYADLVAKQLHAKHHKVEATREGLTEQLNDLVYSQDVPIWSTSTYAQFKVMELAKQQGIKVVLDGQGADELFAGYHHHFIAQWNSLRQQGRYLQWFRELVAAKKTFAHPLLFYSKEQIKSRIAIHQTQLRSFFTKEFLNSGEAKKPEYFADVNQQLLDDIYHRRLKSFLKCEDRCGMWHSVESRTPFSDDVDLINLMFSFSGDKKIKHGTSKHLLREALKDKLPEQIYQRYDKKGFQTPMDQWIQTLKPQLLSEIREARFPFVDYQQLEKASLHSSFDNDMLFKLWVLLRWKSVFSA